MPSRSQNCSTFSWNPLVKFCQIVLEAESIECARGETKSIVIVSKASQGSKRKRATQGISHYTNRKLVGWSSSAFRKIQRKRQRVSKAIHRPLCKLCSKSFYDKSALRKHQSVHTGSRPFLCLVCPKAFSRKEHLQKHQRIHTGEKPFGCDKCGKRFRQKSTLTTHQRTHSKSQFCKF